MTLVFDECSSGDKLESKFLTLSFNRCWIERIFVSLNAGDMNIRQYERGRVFGVDFKIRFQNSRFETELNLTYPRGHARISRVTE